MAGLFGRRRYKVVQRKMQLPIIEVSTEVPLRDECVSIDGVNYPLADTSVATSGRVAKLMQRLSSVVDAAEAIDLSSQILRCYLPTAPVEVIDSLSMDSIGAIMAAYQQLIEGEANA